MASDKLEQGKTILNAIKEIVLQMKFLMKRNIFFKLPLGRFYISRAWGWWSKTALRFEPGQVAEKLKPYLCAE